MVSNLLLPQAPHSLFVRLARLRQLRENLQRVGELRLRSERRIGRETLPDEASSEVLQAWSGICVELLRKLLILLSDGDEAALQQRNSDRNIEFTLLFCQLSMSAYQFRF